MQEIEAATRTDLVLSKVLHWIRGGWLNKCEAELQPYWMRKFEQTLEVTQCVTFHHVPYSLVNLAAKNSSELLPLSS